MKRSRSHTLFSLLVVATALALFGGCRQDMIDQSRVKPYAMSPFYRDSLSARLPPKGTVVHGDPRTDSAFYYGRLNGKLVTEFPIPVTMATLERGRQEYTIYCTPCHGQLGDGRGMIVQRGFPPPPSYHIQRLREAPPGHFYETITRGFGKMFDYSARIQPADRWAIVAYVKALQLSQRYPASELNAHDQQALAESATRHPAGTEKKGAAHGE